MEYVAYALLFLALGVLPWWSAGKFQAYLDRLEEENEEGRSSR